MYSLLNTCKCYEDLCSIYTHLATYTCELSLVTYIYYISFITYIHNYNNLINSHMPQTNQRIK